MSVLCYESNRKNLTSIFEKEADPNLVSVYLGTKIILNNNKKLHQALKL